MNTKTILKKSFLKQIVYYENVFFSRSWSSYANLLLCYSHTSIITLISDVQLLIFFFQIFTVNSLRATKKSPHYSAIQCKSGKLFIWQIEILWRKNNLRVLRITLALLSQIVPVPSPFGLLCSLLHNVINQNYFALLIIQ